MSLPQPVILSLCAITVATRVVAITLSTTTSSVCVMTVPVLVCAIAQVHKHQVFPERFWGKTCDPVNVPKARAFAEERTERLRGYCPNCTSENCVKYMREDGLCLP